MKWIKTYEPEDIFYCEIVDRKCFAYMEHEVWSLENGLQELINRYRRHGYVRISKSMLVNVYKIDRLVADLNMRVKIILLNGEAVILNRSYRKAFYDSLKKIRMEELK